MTPAPIRSLSQIIHALSSQDSPSRHTGLKSAPEARHTQQETLRRDDTGAANRLAAPYFVERNNLFYVSVIATREVIRYGVREQLAGMWCAWDDNDTIGRGGWGMSADAAVADLLEVVS